MELWKNGLLFGAAGILGGLLLAELLREDERKDAEETIFSIDKNTLQELLKKLGEDNRGEAPGTSVAV